MEWKIKDGMLFVSSKSDFAPDPISEHIKQHIEELHKAQTCSIRLVLNACKRAASEAFCKRCRSCGCIPSDAKNCDAHNAFIAEYERSICWSESEIKEISDSYERDKI